MKQLFGSLIAASLLVMSAQAFALEVGQAAPCVVLDDVQADNSVINQCIRTREAGQPYVLIEFFSVTCEDCATNLPKLSGLNASISATTQVRLVSIDRDATAIHSYVDGNRNLINFPVALDVDRSATRAYGIDVTPTVYILDSNNTVVFKHEGIFSDQDIAQIQALVK